MNITCNYTKPINHCEHVCISVSYDNYDNVFQIDPCEGVGPVERCVRRQHRLPPHRSHYNPPQN